MKKIVVGMLLVAGIYLSSQSVDITKLDSTVTAPASNLDQTKYERALSRAFETQQSDIQVQGSGIVIKVLADDNDGSRHQRFILRLPSGQTVLVAHNIDLAPRIDTLAKGDTVEFFGEYEWNNKGGVIHWTHHDPKGRHIGGWLKHNGKTYQ
ncbi:DUF3465 domain-containing protein [Thalassotalea maritima]|uniref:DUF3465 domain-containing protein n=1 Tax=Thalassotalea maritima TaxID=3242416 RepID=UPI0035276A21